jgi:transposase-like protein
MIAEMWRTHWERFIRFFAFPPEIRRIEAVKSFV